MKMSAFSYQYDTSTPPKMPGAQTTDCALDIPLNLFGDTEYSFEVFNTGQIGVDVFLEEVSLKIEHDYDNDLRVDLISPSGTVVNLFANIGGTSNDFGDVSESGSCNLTTRLISPYSDEYCNAISVEEGAAPFVGYYRPMGDLRDFWDGQNAAGMWTLRINDNHFEHTGRLLHVSILFSAPKCQRPVVDSLWTLPDGTMELLLSQVDNCDDLIVEYGPAGFVPGTGDSQGTGDMVNFSSCLGPYTINGILPQQLYDVYVRKKCTDGSWSENSCLSRVESSCAAAAVSHLTDFDTEVLCNSACGAPCMMTSDWRNVAGGDKIDWDIREGAANLGSDSKAGIGHYLYLDDDCPEDDDAYLYSSCIQISATDPTACHFSFDYMLEGTAVTEFDLQISTDGGFNYETIWSAPLDTDKNVWIRNFVNLGDYNEQLVQLRIFVSRNNESGGFISLDNIQFYGSSVIGFPTNVFFVDTDLDGFGNPDNFRPTCSNTAPVGFSLLGTDCNDSNSSINPEGIEIPCNGMDENCNGMLDDNDLPPPIVGDPLYICSGGEAYVSALWDPDRPVNWYSDSVGGQFIISGAIEVLQGNFFNQSPDTLVYTYYAEYETGTCKSISRTPYYVYVLPNPTLGLSFGQDLQFCSGEEIDLTNILLVDINGVSTSFDYYMNQGEQNLIQDPTMFGLSSAQNIYVVGSSDGGCTDELEIPLEVYTPIDLTIDGPMELCPNDSFVLDASWSPAIEEEDLILLWSTGEQTNNLSGIFPDGSSSLMYWLRAEDQNGCVHLENFVIEKGGSIASVDIISTNLSSCDLQDGSISIDPEGGVGPFVYELSSASQNLTQEEEGAVVFSDLSIGVYSLRITDLSEPDCVFDYPDPIVLTGGSAEVAITDVQPLTCAGLNDGSIQISVSGLDPVVSWSNNSDDPQQITGLAPGSYSFTVTDGLCETVVEDIVISSPDPLELQILDFSEQVSCNGLSDGHIDAFVQGGTLPYDYLWSGSTGEASLSNLSPGTYGLSVQDAKGCLSSLVEVTIEEPDALVINSLLSLPSCHDDTDGSINLSVSGGSGIYQYNWDSGIGFPLRNGIGQGNYSVTVSDENSCLVVEHFSLTGLEPITLEVDQSTEPTCQGVADGEIQLSISGGHAAYEYLWSDNSNLLNRSDLSIGHYTLSITDDEGCLVTSDFNFEAMEMISYDYSIDSASCNAIADGSLLFSNEQGEGSFSYAFYMDGQEFNNGELPEGEILIAAVDTRGCRDSLLIDHVAKQPISLSESIEQPNCVGFATGQIGTLAQGPGFPFTYVWEDNVTGPNRSGLVDGIYVVEVTGSNGCTLIDTFELNARSNLTLDVLEIDSVSCFGENDGAIFLDVTGGIEPYSYNWGNGDTSKNRSGLGPGTYNFNVVDALNCVLELDFELNPVSPMVTNLLYHYEDDFPCDNKPVSSIEIQVSGGRAPYLGEWSNGEETLFFDEPEVGIYGLSVMDSYGCLEKFTNINIKEDPEMLTVGLTYNIDSLALCTEGYLVESAEFEILSGQQPWSYSWSSGVGNIGQNSISEESFFFMATDMGSYDFLFEDLNGCTFALEDVLFEEIQPLSLDLLDFSTISCYGYTDGFISTAINGGAAPFDLDWMQDGDPFDGDLQINELEAGMYSLAVTDNFDCKDTISVELQALDSISVVLEFGNTNFCYGDNNMFVSSIDISEGQLSDYDFEWSNGSMVTFPTGLESGSINLTLSTDDCVYEINDLEVPATFDGPLAVVEDELQIGPQLCATQADGSIYMVWEGGTMPYSLSFSGDIGSVELIQDNIVHITELTAGTYDILITDSLGCTLEYESILISDEDVFTVSYEAEPTCFNDSTALVDIDFSGGITPYSVYWTNMNTGETGTNTEGLFPGLYEFELNDGQDCKEGFEVDLSIGPEIVLIDTLIIEPTNGENNGLIGVVTSPSSDNLSLTWEYEDLIFMGDNIIDLFPGEYLLTATDSFDCQEIFPFNLIDSTVGLSSVEWERSFEAFPNPSSGFLNLQSSGEPLGNLDLVLMDMLGRILYTEKINAQDHYQVDLPEHLKSGSYILFLQEKNRIIWATDLILFR